MGGGNARTGRLKLGLQIAAACVVVLIGAFAVGSAVAGPFFWYSCSLDGLEAQGASQASILVSSDGTRLGLLGTSGARQPVALRRIRPMMRQAIIDTEDSRFYSNNGIDYIGIMRALKSNVSAGGIAQGGSTIEQQLVRNLYLTPQQSLSRKLTEACLAVQLDKQWSKVTRALDVLNANPPKLGRKINGGHIALRAVLGYLDLRFAGKWEKGRGRLKRWAARFDQKFPDLKALLPA